jgi:hypothetical protein
MSQAAFRFTEPPSDELADRGREPGFHFIGQTIHLICRLRDHIERLDSGVAYAADDIAVVLRALLHPGAGNRVLMRLHEAFGRAPIEIRLSRPPDTMDVHFSVGSIPVPWSMADDHGAVWVPIADWANTPVVHIVVNGNPKTYTWAGLLNAYANKWGGAHLDPSVPTHLQTIDMYEAGGLSLTGYLLRAAAVQVWFIGQTLLVDAQFVQSGRPLSPEKMHEIRVAAPGAISQNPRNLRARGELQWLSYGTPELGMRTYVEAAQPARFKVQLGKIAWDVAYTPGVTNAVEVVETLRAREPIHKPLAADDFSQGKTILVRGRFVPFQNDQ